MKLEQVPLTGLPPGVHWAKAIDAAGPTRWFAAAGDQGRMMLHTSEGRQTPLRHSGRHPLVCSLPTGQVVVVDSRAKPDDRNVTVLDVHGAVQARFHGGDDVVGA